MVTEAVEAPCIADDAIVIVVAAQLDAELLMLALNGRSEERRVGKECRL